MWNKKFNFIAILLIVVIGLGISFTVVTSADTTNFNSDFMEGTFVGHVDLKNASESYMQSYEDSQNKITYNISTVDDTVSLMDIYYLQGVMNPTKLSINGNDWNIYFSEAIENETGNTLTIVICQCQKEKQGYFIYAIFDSNSTVNTTVNTYGDSYTKFVEPLLKSITLKESSNVPTVSSQFGLTDDQFAQQMELIQQYKAGNTSALEGAQ